jgi:regulation of enolase protein 1 (concanavalin A-like superfamily)
MIKCICQLVVLTLFFFQSFAQVTDTVRIGAIPRPCAWINKPVTYKENSNNSITVGSGKETDLFVFVDGQYYINSATKLLFPPDSDFIFTARVKPAFANMYDGGAILLYSDSSNWASILFESNEKGNWGVSSSVVTDRISDGNYYELTSNPQVWLKVVKAGKIFCFYQSPDGKSWTLTRTFPYLKTATMQLGFYAQSPKGPGCQVEFSEISYKAKKFTDFFTGE